MANTDPPLPLSTVTSCATKQDPDTEQRHQVQTCRLLTIPGEIRNRIYSYATTTSGSVLVHSQSNKQVAIKLPALRQTCRHILRELKSLYFAENTFLLTDDVLTPGHIRNLVKLMGRSAQQVNAVKITRRLRVDLEFRWASFQVSLYKGRVRLEPGSGSNNLGFQIQGVGDNDFRRCQNAQVCDCELRQMAEACGSVMEFVEQYVEVIGKLYADVVELSVTGVHIRSVSECEDCGMVIIK